VRGKITLEDSSVTPAPLTSAWPEFTAADSELDVISKLSRFYGSDPAIVLAGGGNTSCKVGERLFVKASGTSLATMTPDGFVAMLPPIDDAHSVGSGA